MIKIGESLRTPSIILTRATLAAMSSKDVHVTFPGGSCFSPAPGATSIPAAAQRR